MSSHRYPLRIIRGTHSHLPVFVPPSVAQQKASNRQSVREAIRPLPPKVDLRPKMPPVYDQGDLGSCTANAICGAVQYADPALHGSRLFLYYNERLIEGDVKDDAGAVIGDGIASLATYGLCPEANWPYDVSKFNVQPPHDCYTTAKKHTTHAVYSLPNSMTEMKQALSAGFPFVVGIQVYESFEYENVARTGVVPMPRPSDQYLGGHAVVCVGYNDVSNRWIMRNSWGPRWGDAGYFYLPYRYLLDPNLASDLWVITSIHA
jgi:C1A family cysteine protease